MSFYFDISDLVRYASVGKVVGGIQRVQLETAKTLAQSATDLKFFSFHNSYYSDLSFLRKSFAEKTTNEAYDALCALFGGPFSLGAARRGLGEAIRGAAGLLKRRLTPLVRASRPPVFRSTDLVYVGGSYWRRPIDSVLLCERAHRQGASIASFVHDVIPLTFPDFPDEQHRAAFKRLLRLPLHIITNSEYTKNDLLRARSTIGDAGRILSLMVAPLAHEFIGRGRNQPLFPPPSKRVAELEQIPFALVVGTIDKRKNLASLAELWRDLRNAHGDRFPRIVFAGRSGLGGSAMFKTLRCGGPGSPYMLVDTPSDDELAWLYSRCVFTVFPSLAEGWGLPVGESLWFGKPCVASNKASIPEVGGDLVIYANPDRMQDFAAGAKALALNQERLREWTEKIKASRLRTWREAAERIGTIATGRLDGARTAHPADAPSGVYG